MLSALNHRLLAFAKAKVKPVTCPNCGNQFTPFADREIVSWSDFAGTTPCPHCGHAYSLQSSEAEELAPSGPLPQPEGSRIEKKPVAEGQGLYYIPASGSGNGLLLFAVLWNGFLAFCLAFILRAILSGKSTGNPFPFMLFLIPFIAVGVGMAYAGLRAKYATHLLFLGPEFVRLQRQLFRRSKTYNLTTSEIDHVEQKEFYQQNYKPVYGIEIGAGKRRIRFGSALTNDEKRWLCAEIREFLREAGNSSFPVPVSHDAETQVDVVAQPAKTGIMREVRSADEVVYHIPPSGRWSVLLPMALIFGGGGAGAFVWLLCGKVWPSLSSDTAPRHFDAFERGIDGMGLVIVGGVTLVGLGLLCAAIRHRFLRHELALNREEVRLESIVFGRSTRLLPARQVNSVELFELFKTNGKPTSAIRVSAEKESFQFGFRLSEEEKRWLAADMRQFLRVKGALKT